MKERIERWRTVIAHSISSRRMIRAKGDDRPVESIHFVFNPKEFNDFNKMVEETGLESILEKVRYSIVIHNPKEEIKKLEQKIKEINAST